MVNPNANKTNETKKGRARGQLIKQTGRRRVAQMKTSAYISYSSMGGISLSAGDSGFNYLEKGVESQADGNAQPEHTGVFRRRVARERNYSTRFSAALSLRGCLGSAVM